MENEAKQQPPTATGPTWDMVKSITGEALELPPAERDAFVRDRCGEDQDLFAQVLELVAASDTQTDVLSHDGIPARVLGEAVGAAPVAQGTEVGRYLLGASLGSGGMGTVYEAFDAALNRKVAIKFLNLGVASARARRRFETEARALAKLEHPAIARVFEAGVHTVADQVFSLPYFAMEFVPAARTLDAWAREHTPDVRRLLDLLATVCDAVHHGHQKGVLHRDIKPSNILVSGAGEVKVIDFGLSRLAGESAEPGTTNSGDVAGTPAYMAPEAFVQGMNEVDTRADVYSLGVVAYQLLAGCHPRGSADLTPHRAGVLSRSRPAQPLSRLRPECRGDIETIVLKAMESEPADRYQSAAELGADLRRVLRFEPILARPSPVWRHALLFARRHTGLAAASAVALIAVVVGIAGLQVGLSHARQSEQLAILQAQRADRTSRFVMQMLRSASPFRGEKFEDRFSAAQLPGEGDDHWPSAASPGRAPAVGDLIMVAMEQLEASFPDDPALRADMAAALSQTAASISDPRLQSLQKRAAELLQQAYGINDRRTLIARHLLHSTMLLDGAGAALPEIERDLAALRSPATATDRELLCRVATLYLQAMSLSGKSGRGGLRCCARSAKNSPRLCPRGTVPPSRSISQSCAPPPRSRTPRLR